MTHLYNSNGSPVVGWDTAIEEETPQQRFRRRYQAKRCVVCGGARWGRKAICKACWDANDRYCLKCEQVVSLADYAAFASCCKPCKRALEGKARGWRPNGKTLAGLRTAAIHRARGQARADIIHSLKMRGWSWEEIARHPDTKCPSVQAAKTHYGRYYKGGERRVR